MTGVTYDSGDYGRALDEALRLADYENLVRQRDAARARGGSEVRLLGGGGHDHAWLFLLVGEHHVRVILPEISARQVTKPSRLRWRSGGGGHHGTQVLLRHEPAESGPAPRQIVPKCPVAHGRQGNLHAPTPDPRFPSR